MKKASIYQLRNNLASYLDDLVKDEVPVVIHRFNKPIGVLIPPSKKYTDPDYESFFGFMGEGETGTDLVSRVRRNQKEKQKIEKLRNRT